MLKRQGNPEGKDFSGSKQDRDQSSPPKVEQFAFASSSLLLLGRSLHHIEGSKSLNNRSNCKAIRQCDIDEEVEDHVDTSAGEFFGIVGFRKNSLPVCKVEADFVMVVGEGRMVAKNRVLSSGRFHG